MKKIFYALAETVFLFAMFFISGCSKSSSSSGGGGGTTTVSDLVASFINTNSTTGTSTTYTFSYDGQNRLIEEQISDGTAPISYTYGSGIVTQMQGTTTTIYTLNNAGLAASDNQGNTYTYDGNGYLTNETNPNGASTVNTISNNNIVSSVQTTSGGATTTYTYTFTTTPDTQKLGRTFLGASNADLPQSEGINGVSYPFSYTYDSHGRVQTEKIISGQTTLLRTYTYVN